MATHAYSTTFSWNEKTVAVLTNINGIELTAAQIDVTTHQSSDTYTEFIPGMLTAGDVALTGWAKFDDTDGQIAMLTDFNARTSRTGVITFPSSTGTTWTFTGYITSIKFGDAPVDNAIPFSATVKPTGKPTLATSASTGLTTPFFAMSESAVIVPDPANATYSYVATVLTAVSSVTVTPTAASGTITVDGNTVTSGEASSAITLGSAGSVTDITVIVTETNKSPKTYTIHVARAAS
jgi:hypothetical protein